MNGPVAQGESASPAAFPQHNNLPWHSHSWLCKVGNCSDGFIPPPSPAFQISIPKPYSHASGLKPLLHHHRSIASSACAANPLRPQPEAL